MAQQQQQQQQAGPLSIAAISQAFTTVATPAASYDDRINDAQIQQLIINNNTTAGADFHGYTNAQTAETIRNFVHIAALNFSNRDSSLPDTISPANAPQAITYNRFRDILNNSTLGLSKLYSTFATDIYNTNRTSGRYCEKYADFGFLHEDRWVAFPGAIKIKQNLAVPPLTTGMLVAIHTNKYANLKESKEMAQTSETQHTIHHMITMGRLPGPTAGRIGN